MKCSITLIFIFVINLCYSQVSDTINRIDKNGLKIGYWKFDQVFQGEDLSCEGRFILIPLDTTIDYSKDFAGFTNLHFEKNKLTFQYSGMNNQLISVQDGEWISYRKHPGKNNRIAMVDYFNKGYSYKTRNIRAKGDYIFNDYTEVFVLTDSTKRTDTYLANDTNVIQSYNQETTYTYYPNNLLILKNISFSFNSLYSTPDTFYLEVGTKKAIKIDSITSENKKISFFYSKTLSKSQELTKDKVDSIGIVYSPKRSKKDGISTVFIHTSECRYVISFNLYAYDISNKNIDNLKSIALKKNDNLRLHIQGDREYIIYALFKKKLKHPTYNKILRGKGAVAKGYNTDTKFELSNDISTLKKGKYYLYILSEDLNKEIEVNIE